MNFLLVLAKSAGEPVCVTGRDYEIGDWLLDRHGVDAEEQFYDFLHAGFQEPAPVGSYVEIKTALANSVVVRIS